MIRLSIGGAEHEAVITEGDHREGATLGEIEIGRSGRSRLQLEWSAVQAAMPGNLSRLELRRVRAPDPHESEPESQQTEARDPDPVAQP
ncbi:MAG: hypothetical protein FJ253_07200 [Phycisphaerae bacterium]|nr:hypothetical protein [Phycisphaerae bacterium]